MLSRPIKSQRIRHDVTAQIRSPEEKLCWSAKNRTWKETAHQLFSEGLNSSHNSKTSSEKRLKSECLRTIYCICVVTQTLSQFQTSPCCPSFFSYSFLDVQVWNCFFQKLVFSGLEALQVLIWKMLHACFQERVEIDNPEQQTQVFQLINEKSCQGREFKT